MNHQDINTLGELKATGYQSISIKNELRNNLINKLKQQETVFTNIWGYEDSVIPELETAILSKHNINLLGLRGQAKTRLARLMITLLDEYIPIVKGSEVNDDPLRPLSRYAKELIAEHKDDTPISWIHREERFFEKLATPDVTVADLIGDVDPIKAMNLKLNYADDRVIHFGMIPRANRCIFVINEIPDLQARIQVSLFNILQEGDIQIRGFKLRLPLDVQFVFTANPEDYTNRGSIVTPLKDRIGSQILTHYPKSIEIAKKITAQEATYLQEQKNKIHVPELARDIIEQLVFEARKSEYVDLKSGVSARMSISIFENLLSTAERRSLLNEETNTSVRVLDFLGTISAITGKIELVYEGEQEGADMVAQILLNNAIKTIFNTLFPEIKKLKKEGEASPYDAISSWFSSKYAVELLDDMDENYFREQLDSIAPLNLLIKKYQPEVSEKDIPFMQEFILWALSEYKILNKERFNTGFQFNDPLANYIKKI
ncbi:AAA family ATPase [Tenacibaculum halocynthiae]|uniref:AAA family ATPase n=1 Tax=Tenacibaculum halocynthiae TaxID=1254437 RepID=UPI003893CF6E